MLTGACPREFESGRDPIEVVLQDEAIPIRRRDESVPPAVARVIDRALSSTPAARYQDGAEFRSALEPSL
jgi:hypothetical protein